MAMLTYANINHAIANDYADLCGIRHDLKKTRRFAELYLEQVHDSPSAIDITHALGIAALTTYWRCFGTGVRQGLEQVCRNIWDDLDQEQLAYHALFERWRNKSIAHSVDETEDNRPHARYWQERKEEGFISIGCGSTILLPLSDADAKSMIELIEALLKKIDVVCTDQETKLLKWVNSQSMDEMILIGDVHKKKPIRIGERRKKVGA